MFTDGRQPWCQATSVPSCAVTEIKLGLWVVAEELRAGATAGLSARA